MFNIQINLNLKIKKWNDIKHEKHYYYWIEKVVHKISRKNQQITQYRRKAKEKKVPNKNKHTHTN